MLVALCIIFLVLCAALFEDRDVK